MVPVLPAPVFFAQAAPPTLSSAAPRYFTNAENVRRITPGKRFVAFATSGGVRVFERETQKWRVYTQNDGLPTHNIHDVVFDKAKPDMLWVLCGAWGDWANEQPEPDLRIITLDLASGKVESIAPPIAAPRTARMGYHYFLDYRLSISEGWAFVFTNKGVALSWDRATKKWIRNVSVEATPPRPSHYPGHGVQLQLAGAVGNLIIFSTGTRYSVLNGEEGSHISIFNRQTGRWTQHEGVPNISQETVVSNQIIIDISSGPQKFLADKQPNSFLIEIRTVEMHIPKDGTARSSYVMKVIYRLSQAMRAPVEISRTPVDPQTSSPGSLARLPLVYNTDFIPDGNTLWAAGYNDPSSPRSSGIARLDLATGKWEQFKPTTTGIAANFASILKTKQGIFSVSNFVLPKRYDPKLDDFMAPQSLSATDFSDYSILPDPRAMPKNEEEQDFWAYLRVLGRNGNQMLVLAPAEASRRFERQGNNIKTFPVKYDTLFLYDLPTKKLTKLEMRGLEGLVPRAAGFTDSALFFLTEEKMPSERRGNPVVVRWDRNTGTVKRYPESLFREVSVAAQRAAGVRQQADLKKRQTQRNEQLKRFPNTPFPPVELLPPMQFIYPLAGSFLSATGTTWLKLDQYLFRYDPLRDTWVAEGLADSLSPEGETALWKQSGPESWRFEGSEAQRLRGEVSRWSAATGWQKLEIGESARQAGNSVLYHDGALWLTGVGVLRLPQSAWTFQKH